MHYSRMVESMQLCVYLVIAHLVYKQAARFWLLFHLYVGLLQGLLQGSGQSSLIINKDSLHSTCTGRV